MPSDDLPRPRPAKVEVLKAESVGAYKGYPFEYFLPNPMVTVKQFYVKHGAGVDSIQMLMSDGIKDTFSPAFGGSGGG